GRVTPSLPVRLRREGVAREHMQPPPSGGSFPYKGGFMRRLSRYRPSPAMVVALIALFVAMGGSASALVVITSSNIKNGTIRGKDIHKRTITAKRIKKNALGGSVIKESSLGQVPDAAHADSADNATNA